MHSYQHNIKTFNNATRHLTRVERSLYRDLIELYYDTENALTADVKKLQRLVIAQNDEEKEALNYVLDEFFELTGDVYTHTFCDEVIEAYKNNTSAKAAAGKASAAARKKKAEELKAARAKQNEQNSTPVQQPLDECSTNQKPETNNHKPIKEKEELVADEPALVSEYAFEGENFRINQKDFLNHQKIYPNLDLLKEYQQLDIEVRDMAQKQRWGAVNAKLNYRNKNTERNQPKLSSMEAALRHNAEYAAQLEREIEQESLTGNDQAMAVPQR